MKESGANATKAHMENISLGALFLLDACKLADSVFGATRSTQHTIADATGDINKMAKHLRRTMVTVEKEDRAAEVAIDFDEPLSKGMQRMSKGWFEGFLSRTDTETDDVEDENEELDINYGLYDNV